MDNGHTGMWRLCRKNTLEPVARLSLGAIGARLGFPKKQGPKKRQIVLFLDPETGTPKQGPQKETYFIFFGASDKIKHPLIQFIYMLYAWF